MRSISTLVCFAGIVLLATAALIGTTPSSTGRAATQETATQEARAEKGRDKAKSPLEMVEGDMHEFMGHVYEPLYRRLRQSLSSKPVSDEQWKHAASDALIIAEVGNLLLLRSPDETNKAWATNATGIRTFGGLVYRAVREKDYQNAVFYYRHMVEQCNDCHRQFGSPDMRIDP